jgi:hypothetical protein
MVAACALSQRKEESKNKRDFKNDGKSQTFMNSQHGLEKKFDRKEEKRTLTQVKGGLSAVTPDMAPTKKTRETVSSHYFYPTDGLGLDQSGLSSGLLTFSGH